MAKESHDEKKSVSEKMAQAKGHPDKKPLSVGNETKDVMKAPKAPGEKSMGGVHKGGDSHMGNTGMSHARALLEKETERGSHAAHVGGHQIHQHSGKCG